MGIFFQDASTGASRQRWPAPHGAATARSTSTDRETARDSRCDEKARHSRGDEAGLSSRVIERSLPRRALPLAELLSMALRPPAAAPLRCTFPAVGRAERSAIRPRRSLFPPGRSRRAALIASSSRRMSSSRYVVSSHPSGSLASFIHRRRGAQRRTGRRLSGRRTARFRNATADRTRSPAAPPPRARSSPRSSPPRASRTPPAPRGSPPSGSRRRCPGSCPCSRSRPSACRWFARAARSRSRSPPPSPCPRRRLRYVARATLPELPVTSVRVEPRAPSSSARRAASAAEAPVKTSDHLPLRPGAIAGSRVGFTASSERTHASTGPRCPRPRSSRGPCSRRGGRGACTASTDDVLGGIHGRGVADDAVARDERARRGRREEGAAGRGAVARRRRRDRARGRGGRPHDRHRGAQRGGATSRDGVTISQTSSFALRLAYDIDS